MILNKKIETFKFFKIIFKTYNIAFNYYKCETTYDKIIYFIIQLY